MTLSFPGSPTIGDEYQSDSSVYQCDGSKWLLIVRFNFGDSGVLGQDTADLSNVSSNLLTYDSLIDPATIQANIDFTVLS